jgi:hypothetical protein
MDGTYGLSAEIAEMRQRQLLATASEARLARQVEPVNATSWRDRLRPGIRKVIERLTLASAPGGNAGPKGSMPPEVFLLGGLARASGR